jgi:hypothetical protein
MSGYHRGDSGAGSGRSRAGGSARFTLSRTILERVKVLGQESNVGDIEAIGFPPAEEDDRFTRDDPFGDLVQGHGEQVCNGPVEQITIGGKDIMFILVEVNEVAFKLFETFLALD